MNMDFTNYAGMKVFVSRPLVVTVKRSWIERLFSWPWHPLRSTKSVTQSAVVPTGECYRIGNELHCGETFYEILKNQSTEQEKLTW